MKRIVLLAFMLSSIALFSQDTIRMGNWEITGKVSLNLSQSYFSNWAMGGVSNLTTIGRYTMSANYKKNKHEFTNWLDLALGYTLFLDAEPMKTDDKIEYIPSYRYQFHKNWLFTVLGKFATQFAKGYDYSLDSTQYISDFMAPAYIDIGPGIMYKPIDWFFVNLSPVTATWIVVNDQTLANAGAFGVTPAVYDDEGNIITPGEKVRSMFGAKMLMVINKEVYKNINIGTKLELFSDYLNDPEAVIVNWQVLIGLKVNDWLNVDIQTTVLYDEKTPVIDNDGNVGPRTQFRQLLMLSVGYAF